MDDLTHAPFIAGDPSEVPRYFSLAQRIGRIRYFVYLLSGMLGASALLLMIYILCLALPPNFARLVFDVSQVLLKNILMPMIFFIMVIRRLHDINLKGWWSLTVLIPYVVAPALVPFATVILLMVPGSEGSNRFGLPPRDNGPALKVAAIVLPLCLFMLFFALRNAPTHAERLSPNGSGSLKSYGS